MPPTRLGIIDYTNVAPLLATLPQELHTQDVAWQRGVPTQINQALLAGNVDLANISAFEFIEHAHVLKALPDFSIAVLGAVYSVNLFHTVPWHDLGGARIAVTTHSATSVKLLETLLQLEGLNATLHRAEGELEVLLQDYAAVLLIGDDALREWYATCGPVTDATQMFRLPSRGVRAAQNVLVTDLATLWYKHTQLPFVFAVWATPADHAPDAALVQAMRRARRYGVGHLADIATTQAVRLGLPQRIVQHYLWNFRYHLEAPDRAGLERFADLVRPGHAPLQFWDV